MSLTVVILTRNEEALIEGCLKSLRGLNARVLVVDDCSTDTTVSICQRYGAEVVVHRKDNFSQQRTFGLSHVDTDWVFYLDADERLTNELRGELSFVISEGKHAAYYVRRRNFYLGREWKTRDRVHRLFLRTALSHWEGAVHESPVFKGTVGELKSPLIHFTHRDVLSMLRKTLEWSETEASLRLAANHPPVLWWRLPRVMLTEFWRVGVQERGILNGTEGWIETIYQCFSMFMTYARLWEMQRKEMLSETYKRIDTSLEQTDHNRDV